MSHSHSDHRDSPVATGSFLTPLALTAVMVALAIYQGVQIYHARQADPPQRDVVNWFLLVWAAFNALVACFSAIWRLFPGTPPEDSVQQRAPTKLLVLLVGGALGLSTVVLGLAFMYEWGDVLLASRTEWKDAKPWAPVGMVLAGLAVMFISLLAVKSEERTHAGLRRLLYGYNAVLTGLLVLAILGVFNVGAFFYGTQYLDFTESHIYTTSDQTRQILQALPKPVRLIVVFPEGDPLRTDLNTLLANCLSVAGDKLAVANLNPRTSNLQDLAGLAQLIQSYPELRENNGPPEGVVVAYEDETGKALYEVLKRTPDLQDVSGFGNQMSRSFKGEQAIASAIVRLREGKKNSTLYFTQGNGELDVNDVSSRQDFDRGVGLLKEELKRANYAFEVKDLHLEPEPGKDTPPRVPDDAFAVVMAGPAPITDPKKLEPLREYMKRDKAKMIVFLDVKRNRQGEIQPTGLESFLAEYGVMIANDVVLNARQQSPTVSTVEVSKQADRQIQDVLSELNPFPLIEARSVRPGQAAQFTVKPFLETQSRPPGTPHGQWTEVNIRGGAQELAEYVGQMYRSRRPEFDQKTNGQPVPVAVTVRERSEQAPDPNDPHAFMREDTGEPRLVVFGDATMISNGGLLRLGDAYYLTFQNALSWLRGRPEMLTAIRPVKRNDYRLKISPEQSSRLRWLSGPALLVLIVAGGTGVWLMRRR